MMFSRFAGLAILYLAGVEAGVARTWVIGEGYPLTISRMDPIVSPGKVAGHTHHVIGGSAFNREWFASVADSCGVRRVQNGTVHFDRHRHIHSPHSLILIYTASQSHPQPPLNSF